MLKSLTSTPVTLFKKYNSALINSPYKTKMTTLGFTYFLADYISQSHIEKKEAKDYSVTRSVRQSSVGAFFAAPSLHVWHTHVLPKFVQFCSRHASKVLLSVFLNETIFAGYFVSCLLFSFEALKTFNVQAGAQNVQEKFLPTIGASVKFWTGISFLNYGFMPIHLRPVFVSVWSVIWQSYVSYVSNNKTQDTSNTATQEKEEEEIEINYALLRKFKVLPLQA